MYILQWILQDNLSRRIDKIKKYLSESILCVNNKSVDIEKPIIISNGVELRVHVLYIHDKSINNPADHYKGLLMKAVWQGEIQLFFKDEWKLSVIPRIGNIVCTFQR